MRKKVMREAILMCYLSEQDDANNDSSKAERMSELQKLDEGHE